MPDLICPTTHLPPDTYLTRCLTLHRRGLSLDLMLRVAEVGDVGTLEEFEALTDEQIAELNVCADEGEL